MQIETSSGCGRMSAVGVLRDKAEKLKREASGLIALADTIEDSLLISEAAEQALWKLAIK